ncbi:TIGR01212 family radical SAM protein [Alistipes sp.]|uniref:TIGR01212 family radical SAM protein n=1 Tax=Alistipes sp. TaxID=1872444 RepID=UPI003AEF1B38
MNYPWGDTRRFNSYAGYFRRLMGGRIQKISVDAGFTCPNRDGTIARGGCTFCNNGAFTPSYCMTGRSIGEQIEEGIAFHRNRYRTAQRYLVYFQSFSNTYAPLARLRDLYAEALAHPQVAGLVVGTRPDCVDPAKLDLLASLARDRYVAVEYGIESTFDATLRAVNRGHDFAAARRAVELSAERGLAVGAHFILGLPGETDQMLLEQVDRINALPLTTVKFHQLQIFRDTPMAREFDADPARFRFRTLDEYLDLVVEILRRLRSDLVVERFASEAPPRYHYGPNWGLVRNEQLWALLEKRLAARNTYQGEIFIPLQRTDASPAGTPPAAPRPESADSDEKPNSVSL